MNWMLFLPELSCLFMSAVFLGLSTREGPDHRGSFFAALLLSFLVVAASLVAVPLTGTLFLETYRVDLFSQVFKGILAMGLLLVVCLCGDLKDIEERHHPEFYLLLTVATLAMMMMVSSVHLLTLYLSMELSSYALYILVPMRRGHGADVEAGIKYFLVGIFASAVMLFGLAALYGATQASYVTEMMQVLPGMMSRPMVAVGLLFTLCGFFFKLAVFPFHYWAPDVYQGGANQVVAYIATASKVAAVAILIRLVALSGGDSAYLAHVLVGLSVVSMTLGNLVAIVQKDMKRLLAYSSIAHAGYVLIGILTMSPEGYAGAIFYGLAYLVMQFTCFLVIVQVAHDGEDLQIEQLAGLHRRSPILAMALMIGIFSLAGIPPTAGFTAKFVIFAAAMGEGHFFLPFIGMINVVISLYYYLMVIRAAYLLDGDEGLPLLHVTFPTKVLAAGLVVALIWIGMAPQPIFELARAAAAALM